MRSYETSRSYFGFLEFLAWLVTTAGGVLLVVGIMTGQSMRGFRLGGGSLFAGFFSAVPGLVLIFFGLSVVVLVQVCRAGVDTAENTGNLFQEARTQGDLLRALVASSHQSRNVDIPGQIAQAPADAPMSRAATGEGSREEAVVGELTPGPQSYAEIRAMQKSAINRLVSGKSGASINAPQENAATSNTASRSELSQTLDDLTDSVWSDKPSQS